jgi:hypothetical protein
MRPARSLRRPAEGPLRFDQERYLSPERDGRYVHHVERRPDRRVFVMRARDKRAKPGLNLG